VASLNNRFSDVVKICEERPRLDYDIINIVSGGTGEGKSTLAIQLARVIDPGFEKNMSAQLAFTKEELWNATAKLGKYKVIIVDEAVNVLFKRDFMKKSQKELLRMLDMVRRKNLVMFFCVPSIWSLDSHFVNSRVHLWLFVHSRGFASLYKPLKGPLFAYAQDPWCRHLNVLQYCNYKFRSSPNYHGQVRFEVLPRNLKKKYEKIKNERSDTAHMDDAASWKERTSVQTKASRTS